MLVQGMYGLGDNIYQRAVLREVPERVYLRTCWPQLYSDLSNIRTVIGNTRLRTQNKNLQRIAANTWRAAPSLPPVKLSYSLASLKRRTILQSMAKTLGVVPKVFDMPRFVKPILEKRYAVVRPVTIRAEWYNRARGPESVYVCEAARLLRERGFQVVSVADIAEKEWCEEIPESDLAFNHGELALEDLMGLIQHASLVVGGVGWIVPACIAFGVPLITILGGQGGHNAPEKIVSTPMDDSRTRFIRPDRYCMCTDTRHVCDKKITNFPKKFKGAMAELCLNA